MKDSTKVYLYTGGWILYYLQSLFHLEGSLVSTLWVVGLILVSLFYVILCHETEASIRKNKVSMFVLSLDALILLLTIYGVIFLFNDSLYIEEARYNYLKRIYCTLLPVYFFYYYAIKGVLTSSVMRRLTIVFSVYVIVNFVLFFFQNDSIVMTNNGGYLCVAMIPLMLLFENRKGLQNGMVLFFSLLTIVSMKRGAILVMFVLLVVYFSWSYKRGRNKIKTVWLVMSLVLIITLLFIYLENTNYYFQNRLYKTMNGYTSGRDELYSTLIWAFFEDTTDLQFIFGKGALATMVVTRKNMAHCDWLELATNQGIIGIVFYFVYICSIIKTYINRKVWNDQVYILFMVSIVIIMKSLFSMSYSSMDVITFSALGYILGCLRREDCVIKK